MGAQQSNAKREGEEPFKGVPSDQVGRGGGQDPPDYPGEGKEESPAIQMLREEGKQIERSTSEAACPRRPRRRLPPRRPPLPPLLRLLLSRLLLPPSPRRLPRPLR